MLICTAFLLIELGEFEKGRFNNIFVKGLNMSSYIDEKTERVA